MFRNFPGRSVTPHFPSVSAIRRSAIVALFFLVAIGCYAGSDVPVGPALKAHQSPQSPQKYALIAASNGEDGHAKSASAEGAGNLAAGSATVSHTVPRKLPAVATASLYPMGNTAKVKLQNRIYRGKLFVEANGVDITGVPGSTIDGGAYILANYFRMSGVTVDGNVVILGSDADLSGCTIKGTVESRGRNNKW